MTDFHQSRAAISSRRSHRLRGETRRKNGFVVIYFVIVSFLLFGMVGLSIDSGRMFFKKRTMQAAADAAAVAAAFEIQRNNAANLIQSAEHDSSLNGVPASEVTVNYPPSANAGSYAGNARFVEVTVQENVPTTLLRLVGPEYGTVRAHAVAGEVQAGDYCMLALDRTAASALWIHGTDTLNLGCGIMSNSNSSSGLRTTGSINVDASFIGVSGANAVNGGSGSVSPTPLGNVPPKIDPFINLPEPNYSGWPSAVYNSTTNTYSCPGGSCVFGTPVNINGGGGNGNGNGNGGGGTSTVTFQPGVYVFEKGLRVSSGNVNAQGVTFFSTDGNMTFTGSSTLTITPSTSGPYKGISMFVSRSAPTGTLALGQGGTTLNFRGAFYAPTMEMRFAGTPYGSSPWAMLVADTIEFAGTSTLNLSYPPSNEAPNIYRVTLVR